jgi:hypothetical protein
MIDKIKQCWNSFLHKEFRLNIPPVLVNSFYIIVLLFIAYSSYVFFSEYILFDSNTVAPIASLFALLLVLKSLGSTREALRKTDKTLELTKRQINFYFSPMDINRVDYSFDKQEINLTLKNNSPFPNTIREFIIRIQDYSLSCDLKKEVNVVPFEEGLLYFKYGNPISNKLISRIYKDPCALVLTDMRGYVTEDRVLFKEHQTTIEKKDIIRTGKHFSNAS